MTRTSCPACGQLLLRRPVDVASIVRGRYVAGVVDVLTCPGGHYVDGVPFGPFVDCPACSVGSPAAEWSGRRCPDCGAVGGADPS